MLRKIARKIATLFISIVPSCALATGVLNVLLASGELYFSTTLTAGTNTSGSLGAVGYDSSNFSSIGPFGSVTTTTDNHGVTFAALFDLYVSSSYSGTLLYLTGPSAAPGPNYFYQISINGHTFTSASAISTGTSGNTRHWEWNSAPTGISSGMMYNAIYK